MLWSIFVILVIAILLVMLLEWLGPMAKIPGNFLAVFRIIIIVGAVIKVAMILLGGF